MKIKGNHTLLLIAAFLVIAAVLTVFELADSPSMKPVPATAVTLTHESGGETSYRININTAGIDELMTLSEIGSVRAQAIIDYRESNGNFVSVDELGNVEGISKSVVDLNRSRITV